MPIRLKVLNNGNLIYAEAVGILTPEDIVKSEDDIENNPLIKNDFTQIFDVSKMEGSRVTLDSFNIFLKRSLENKKRSENSELAIVVTEESSYHKACHYKSLVQPSRRKVFVTADLDIAKEWLNIDLDLNSTK